MTATEQQFLVNLVARLEEQGKVEALREANRDHIHVFAFADGSCSSARCSRVLTSSIAHGIPATRPTACSRPATRSR